MAKNLRKPLPDNSGRIGEGPFIEGAPDSYLSSAPVGILCQKLKDAGWPVELSDNAGSYLCEETLFTLEHYRAATKWNGTVLFCHIPPLGTFAGNGKTISADYSADFVKALIEAVVTDY
ncbi:MAG: hypothetical protein Kow00107_04720 [Planctomycetota bacterium]